MSGLSIALPKGRLLDEVREVFARAGTTLPGLDDRRLRVEEGGLIAMVVRPLDVPVYVEYGAADVGVVGRDVLLEAGRDLYEPLDLGIGRCRLVLAAPRGRAAGEAAGRIWRVATKYPRVAEAWLRRTGRTAEVVRLSGNIELAPLAGLADAIVDLVDTGRTLRENDLEILEEVADSTARLVVNRAAMKLRREAVAALVDALAAAVAPAASAPAPVSEAARA